MCITASGLVVVNVDPFQLQIRVAMVSTSGIDTVLVADNFPELGTDLVAALAALNVNNFAHGCGAGVFGCKGREFELFWWVCAGNFSRFNGIFFSTPTVHEVDCTVQF